MTCFTKLLLKIEYHFNLKCHDLDLFHRAGRRSSVTSCLMLQRPLVVTTILHKESGQISQIVCLLGFSVVLNIWGHIATVPTCSSDTLTIVLPHRNAMQQTQDMTPHPVTVYGHRADLSLCYPLMWNIILENKIPILLSWVRPDRKNLPWPSTHTSERSTLWCCYRGGQ